MKVVLQSDQKILVLGQHIVSNVSSMIATRFNTNGTRDTSFGLNGLVNISELLTLGLYASGMKLLSNGKIVVSGNMGLNILFVIQFNTNGSLDTGFGTKGYTLFMVPTEFF